MPKLEEIWKATGFGYCLAMMGGGFLIGKPLGDETWLFIILLASVAAVVTVVENARAPQKKQLLSAKSALLIGLYTSGVLMVLGLVGALIYSPWREMAPWFLVSVLHSPFTELITYSVRIRSEEIPQSDQSSVSAKLT